VSGKAPNPVYAARNAPLRPETVWTLENAALVERVGGRAKTLPIDCLRSLQVIGEAGTGRRAAHLIFAGGRAVIPAQSLSGSRLFEDRSAAFDSFIAAVETEWGGRPDGRLRESERKTAGVGNGLVWGIGLMAAGAIFMIVVALVSGMSSLGLALAARLLFVAILLGAALPWLGRD
jgi:hypothetical protein